MAVVDMWTAVAAGHTVAGSMAGSMAVEPVGCIANERAGRHTRRAALEYKKRRLATHSMHRARRWRQGRAM